jgi:uncharacterized protein with von Willebrand factor type A (vWA) domain
LSSDGTLTRNVLRFCAALRAEHGFAVGHAEARDALRALEVTGVGDPQRARGALRLVFCGKRQEIAAFERAFDAYFLHVRGLRQRDYAPRHTRGDEARRAGVRSEKGAPPRDDSDDGGEAGVVRARRPVADASDSATSWAALLARYSPAAGRAAPPAIAAEGLTEMLEAASRVIAEARLGRSRRWRPQERGERFDLRRTLRRSLHTGGDPVSLRRLGHPPRNPRFVVLVDGSRSMSEHGALMLQFAYAMCRRSRRVSAHLFSTESRDVTRILRELPPGGALQGVGEAWGGGTRIGANLLAFARGAGRRLLSGDTVVIVASDGLDLGDVEPLVRAMREIRRRSAAIVWINPLASTPGYAPTARGMHAALPYVTSLAGARDAATLGRVMRGATGRL